MFHHYPGLWDVIAKHSIFNITKFSLFSQLLLKTLYNFLFCFCYSFIFHLFFDPILNSTFVSGALNKFDDFIGNLFQIYEREEDNHEFKILEENKSIIRDNFELTVKNDTEKLINDNTFEKNSL